jgi:hypothetical protein
MKGKWILILLLVSPFARAGDGVQTFVPYPKTGIQLGSGWNSLVGQKVNGVCVLASPDADKGQTRDITYEEVTDTSSLMRSLSVTAEAKVGILQGGAANATASFAESAKLDNYGLNISVDIRITDGESFLVPVADASTAAKSFLKVGSRIESTTATNQAGTPIPAGTIQLTPWAAALAARPLEFLKSCGDSFVATIRMGSGIQGVYTVETRSDAEKQSTAASIGASYGSFSGSATANQLIETLESAGRVLIHYTQQGGDGTIFATDDKTLEV